MYTIISKYNVKTELIKVVDFKGERETVIVFSECLVLGSH